MITLDLSNVTIRFPNSRKATRVTLYRPGPDFGDNAHSFHLYVKWSADGVLDNATPIINTELNAADRDKIRVFGGMELSEFPEEGLGSLFIDRPVFLDLRGTPDGYLFYCWKDVTTGLTSDYNVVYFPSTNVTVG